MSSSSPQDHPTTKNTSLEKTSYKVFARKYRPQVFGDLYGQEILVKTLTNAIGQGRIPHALLLCGVRGIGKTTTARLIAKALNCTGRDPKVDGLDPCGTCVACQNILLEKNLDVVEMDAASRTSVDNIREIITNINYKPVAARYKVQIIDEVHMLTKQAFNALLKSIEEPPEHVLFIFATTEPERIPDTVLSRCVRFDLRAIGPEVLITLFDKVLKAEQVEAEPQALQLLADAAAGSARDGLSLLERAVGLTMPGVVTAEAVRSMLGLGRDEDTFEMLLALFEGDVQKALHLSQATFEGGADPFKVLAKLTTLTFEILRYKVSGGEGYLKTLKDSLKTSFKETAQALSVAQLHRFWSVLAKSTQDLSHAPNAIQGFELILIRLCYLSFTPSPTELLKAVDAQTLQQKGDVGHQGAGTGVRLEKGQDERQEEGESLQKKNLTSFSTTPPVKNKAFTESKEPSVRPLKDVESTSSGLMNERGQSENQSQSQSQSKGESDQLQQEKDSQGEEDASPKSFEELVELCGIKGESLLKAVLTTGVRPVSFDVQEKRFCYALEAAEDATHLGRLKKLLSNWTGEGWRFEEISLGDLDSDKLPETLKEIRLRETQELLEEAKKAPIVKKALDSFEGAVIEEVRRKIPSTTGKLDL